MNPNHPLLSDLKRVHQMERWWLWIYSCSMLIALSLPMLIALGVLDYWVRSDSFVVRWTYTLAALGLLLFFMARIIVPVIRFRRHEVDIARQIELSNPQLGNQLSLAAGFLTSGRENGSDRLREQVVTMAQSRWQPDLVLHQIRTAVPWSRMMGFVAGIVLSLLLVFSFPVQARIAAHRLLAPATPLSWPSIHHLMFDRLPQKIATGQSLNVHVKDRHHRFPDKVVLEIDDGQQIRVREMSQADSVARYRIKNVTQSLRIRARGGDSKTEWVAIDVVQSPEVVDVQVLVNSPAYLQLKPQKIPAFQKVWSGSRLVIEGTTDQTFAHATMELNIQGPGDPTPVLKRLVYDGEGDRFRFPAEGSLDVESDLEFRFQFTTVDGVTGRAGRTFRIPVRQDEKPFCDLLLPAPRPLYGINETVSLTVVASDDQRLGQVALEAKYRGEIVFRDSIDVGGVGRHAFQNDPVEWRQTFDLRLADILPPEATGDLIFVARATDSKDQSDLTNPLTIRLGSPKQIQSLSQQKREEIFDQLSEARLLQQDALAMTQLLLNQSEGSADDSRILRMVSTQRQVSQLLLGDNGIVAQCRNWLEGRRSEKQGADLKRVQGRVEGIRNEIQDSVSLLDESRGEVPPRQTVLFQSAEQNQKIVLQVLTELAGQYDQQNRIRSITFKLGDLLRQQKDIAKQIESVQQQSLLNAPSSESKTEVQRVTNAEISIANQLAELNWSVQKLESKSISPELLRWAEILQTAESLSQAAARQLADRQFGQAGQTVEQWIQVVEKALRLAPRKASDQTASQRWKDARDELEQIRRDQQGLQSALSQWNQLSDLEKQDVKDSIRRSANQVSQFRQDNQSLLSDDADKTLQNAEASLNSAVDDLNADQAVEAKEKIARANQQLDQVVRELNAAEARSQQRERQQLLAELQVEFQQWKKVQKKISNDFQALYPGVEDSVENQTPVDDLLQQQLGLEKRMSAIQTRTTALFIVNQQITKIIDLSKAFRNDLERRATEPARAKLQNLLVEISRLADFEIKSEPPEEEGNRPQENQNQQTSSADQQVQITEFEVDLLRQMQEEILMETESLQEKQNATNDPKTRAALNRQLLSLSEKQGALVQLIDQYIGPATKLGNKPSNNAADVDPPDKIPPIELPPLDDPRLDVPDIPRLECGGEEFFQESVGPSENSDQTQEKQEPQEPDKSDKPPQIQSVAPFAKQGEDLGQDSDPVRNRLSNVRQKMLDVQQMLIDRKTAPENFELQREIIEELKLFVTDQQKKPKNSSEKTKADQTKGDQAATSSESQSNDDSDPEASSDGTPEADRNSAQFRLDEIWGHLPQRLRQKKLSMDRIKYLPKYQKWIEAYYKQLSRELTGRN